MEIICWHKCNKSIYYNQLKERRKAMEDWNKKIDELTELVSKLIRLALEIGTLASVIKMILYSIR